MVFLYHPPYDRNIKRKDVFHYEKILLAFGLHCFLYSNLLGTPIAIHSPTELEPSSSDLADSSESSSSSEPEHPTTPADAATPQDDIT